VLAEAELRRFARAFPPYQLVDGQVVVEARAQSDPGVVRVAGDHRQFHTFSELLARRATGSGSARWSTGTWLILQTRPRAWPSFAAEIQARIAAKDKDEAT
jgi:hypothetical protein